MEINDFLLKDKVAVITGGASGIGLAITKCMINAGATVIVISSRSSAKANESVGDLPNVSFVQYDINESEKAESVAKKIIDKYKKVDILVNNAGNHCKKAIEEMTIEEYKSVLNIHLIGGFAMTRAFVPHMKANKDGSILFMASMTSYIGQPNVCGYASAKAGVLGLVHTLATECGPYNIRVNAIAPGWIDTPMFHKATDNDPTRLKKILGRIPMQEVGKDEDVGYAAVFLSSQAAKYITGICLPVDGGALIGF